jgi:hypothetical protein
MIFNRVDSSLFIWTYESTEWLKGTFIKHYDKKLILKTKEGFKVAVFVPPEHRVINLKTQQF